MPHNGALKAVLVGIDGIKFKVNGNYYFFEQKISTGDVTLDVIGEN
jgi:hypothetical protein